MGRHDRALEYRAQHHGFPPDRLLDSKSKRARIANRRLGTPDTPGVLARLLATLEHPRAFVADGVLLGLPKAAHRPEALYNQAKVESWRSAIWLAFAPPWWARLEVDERGTVHAHVVAGHDACRCDLEGEPIRSSFGLAHYLAKAFDQRGLEAETLLLRRGKALRRAPALSFGCGIPKG